MNRIPKIARFVIGLFVLGAALGIVPRAQVPRPDFNRVRTIDVENYTIRTSFDRRKKLVFGDTTVTFRPLGDGLSTLELDSVGLRFESVQMEPEGRRLEYRTTPGSVIVSLGGVYRKSDLIRVRFRYTANPAKGIYFVDAQREPRKPQRDAQIWTQGEPEEARYWIPSYDFPDDKATSEQFITVESEETAIANGDLIGTTESGKTKTYHFKMKQPHSVYLTSFVVGRYSRVTEKYKDIPLTYYFYPGKEETARKAFAQTAEMIGIFADLTAIDYPYAKYDQTVVAKFNFGGMENITATTFSDEDIFLIEQPFGKNLVEDLVSHELAHSWFGNLVTCRNWAELWLNESFATFMEAAYRERKYGRSDYLRKIKDDAEEYFAENARLKRRRGLFNQLAKPDDSIFDAVTYQKGSAVLHTLREYVGDEVFWKSVRLYLKRFKWKNVETPDLKRAFEDVSGRNLDRFFEQWVYGAGHPILRFERKYDPDTRTLVLDIEQVQIVDGMSPEPFEFSVDVEFTVGKLRRVETLNIDRRKQIFSFEFDTRPGKPVFDPEMKIPLLQTREK